MSCPYLPLPESLKMLAVSHHWHCKNISQAKKPHPEQVHFLPVSLWDPANTHRISQALTCSGAIAALLPPMHGQCRAWSEGCLQRCPPLLLLVPAASVGTDPSFCVSGYSPGKGLQFNLLTPKDIFHRILETWKTLLWSFWQNHLSFFSNDWLPTAVYCRKLSFALHKWLWRREVPSTSALHLCHISVTLLLGSLASFSVFLFPEFENLQSALNCHKQIRPAGLIHDSWKQIHGRAIVAKTYKQAEDTSFAQLCIKPPRGRTWYSKQQGSAPGRL